MQATLSPAGYVISKASLTMPDLTRIRADLTVRAKTNPSLNMTPPAFPVYSETPTHITVPRFYGLDNIGVPHIIFPDLQERPKLAASIDLRDAQVEIANKTLDVLTRGRGAGLLHLYTGAGKTVLALHVISQLKLKTLIIVHKSILLNQWIDRIAEFIPGAAVGVIQGKRLETEGKDIVIAMLQSLSLKEYDPAVFADVGLLVVDECHHIGAEVFSRALTKVAPKHSLGLSATPDRKDGLSRVFKWYLGNVIHKASRESPCTVVKQIYYHSEGSSTYMSEPKNYQGRPMLPVMLNNVAAHEPRNRLILHELVEYLNDDERQIMVMGERIAQLKWLQCAFRANPPAVTRGGGVRPATSGLYIGQMKQSELDESATKDVIFASAAICREGLDIPTLNTMIMATPQGDVVQSCGRIMRRAHTMCPLIIDIVDCFSVFHNQARSRGKFYDKSRFQCFPIHYTEGGSYLDLDIGVDEMRAEAANARNATVVKTRLLEPDMALFREDDE